MNPSFFKVPWIERLLSTFDPDHDHCESQKESLVAQVLSVKAVTDDIDGLAIGGQGSVHDNQLFVNAVFTKEAVQKFNKEEEQDGCSGAEFDEIKNSIITIRKYQILPRLHSDQAKSDMLVCVEYFTLVHFDAVPRLSGPPLMFACHKRSITTNMQKLWRLTTEDLEEPAANTSHSSHVSNSDSAPHLTQLLDAIENAAQKDDETKQRAFVFEVAIPKPATSDTSSTVSTAESDLENIDILERALKEMEVKLALAKALHHHVAEASGGEMLLSQAQDSQVLHNTPTFRIQELGQSFQDTTLGIMADFDESEYEVPYDVLKKLENIEEWRPGYVPPASSSAGPSLDIPDMTGGGLSSSLEGVLGVTATAGGNEEQAPGPSGVQLVDVSDLRGKKHGEGTSAGGDCVISAVDAVESGAKNKQNERTGKPKKLSQLEPESMSLGSDDWDVHSVESIGLSSEGILHADSQEFAQGNQDDTLVKAPPSNSAAVYQASVNSNLNSPNKDVSPAHIKRKRHHSSEESASKIPRHDSPDKGLPKSVPALQRLSPIEKISSQELASGTSFSHSRSVRNQDSGSAKYVLHSTPASSGAGDEGGGCASKVTMELEAGPVQSNTNTDKERTGSDLFGSDPNDSAFKVQLTDSKERNSPTGCRASLSQKKDKKQPKVVHFDNSISGESHETEVDGDHDNQLTNSTGTSHSGKETLSKNDGDSDSETQGCHDKLNNSVGFEPSGFYRSPSPGRMSEGKKPRRGIANLKSPQIPASIPTPINSLPSHQPRQSRSATQETANEILTNPSTVEPDEVDRLSNIRLEDEVLQWCTRYFIAMATGSNKQTSQNRRRDRRS